MSEPNPWVAPDTAAEPPPAATPAGTAPAGTAGADRPGVGMTPAARRPPPPPGVPVPLRPMSAGDILDGALRILKLAPRTVLLLAAAFVLPVQLLLAFALPELVGGEPGGLGGVFGTGDDGISLDLLALRALFQGLSLALVCVGVTHLVNAWYAGEDRTTAEVFRFVGSRALPALAAWFLVHLVEALFLPLALAGAIVPLTWFLVAVPVVAAEGLGAWRALGRSRRLTSRRFGAVLGVAVLVWIVDTALLVGLGALAGVYVAFQLPFDWLMATVFAIGSLFVTVPFVAGAAALVHLDLRVRTEAHDVDLAIPRRFADARR